MNIKKFKRLLIGYHVTVVSNMFKRNRFIRGFVETSGYRKEQNEHCFRTLYRLKREYYYKIIWDYCYSTSRSLEKDIVRSSKYCPYTMSVWIILHSHIKLDYSLSAEDYKGVVKLLHKRILNGIAVGVCDTCMVNIKQAGFSIIVDRCEGTCEYCIKYSIVNAVRIAKDIGLTLFGKY